MTSAEMRKYRQMLVELRAELRGVIEHAGEAIPEDTHPPGEHEIAPSEGVDIEASLERSEQEILRQVNDALARVDAGKFGRCQMCGRDIGATRLDNVPYTAFCIDCERTREKG